MDFEKAYKEVLSRAKTKYDSMMKQGVVGMAENIAELFPELKESEDEQPRKWILEYLYDGLRKSDEQFKDQFKGAIAWFEKQGEHIKFLESIQIGDEVTRNPDGVLVNLSQLKRKAEQGSQNLANSAKTCKNEPKFKVGDIITPKDGGREPWQIMQVDISDKKYRFKDGNVIHFSQEDDYELAGQNPAWSEDDEKMVEDLIEAIDTRYSVTDYNEMVDWLKSLKERYTWKPSDEQMSQLECVAIQNKNNMLGKELMTLFNDLKKLTE